MENTSHNAVVNARYFRKRFPTAASALEYYEQMKWGDKPVCPKCGSAKTSPWRNIHRKNSGDGWHRCNNYKCRAQFTARLGTIFERTHITDLRTWFEAWCYIVRYNGISVMQLADEMEVAPDTAWHMAHRIRCAMASHKEGMKLEGTAESDDAGAGGLEGNKHQKKRLHPGGGFGGKIGINRTVERGEHGRAITTVLPDVPMINKKGKEITTPDISEEVIEKIIKQNVKPGTIICTDSSPAYSNLKKLGYTHFTVNHKQGEYVVEVYHPGIEKKHTNTVESGWRVLKTGYRCHVHYSRKHAQRYFDELDFRHNKARVFKTGEDGILKLKRRAPTVEAFEEFIRGCLGKTLSWEKLTGKRKNSKKRKVCRSKTGNASTT